ncbi:MAG: hypothetical protein QM725_13285 [Lacibacter sp.]
MKTVLIVLLPLFAFFNVNAQYKFAIGASAGTTGKVYYNKTPHPDSVVYELSIKALTKKYLFVDIIGGIGKDYYNFTILSEYHKPVFYPVDLYLGLGVHAGAYKASHWSDDAAHKKTIAGFDGVLGLQLTLRPIAFSISTRPVYNLYPDDAFFWLKQVSARICF